MQAHAAEFRRCLAELDVAAIRKLWRHVRPGLPQPATDHEALVTIHVARTAAQSLPIRHRAYSHRWLLDNGYPSQLPDELKPRAERLYPKVVGAVGLMAIAPKAYTPLLHEVMRDAISECYADRRPEPEFVRGRMFEARAKEWKKLGL